VPQAALLSVVIPTWNEAPLVADAVANARAIGDEVIVVDGRGGDGTAALAREAGARVVLTAKGRGIQEAAGGRAASGDVLLFLHADTRLPAEARHAILRALDDPSVIGGGFYVRFLPSSWFTRLLEPVNDLRRRIVRRYYGDAGVFVRAEVYRRLGAHRPWPVMHDYEWSGRMERAGRCVYIRDLCSWTSARRFQGRELRTLVRWLAVQGLYGLRAPPRVLGRFYPDVRCAHDERFIALARAKTKASATPALEA